MPRTKINLIANPEEILITGQIIPNEAAIRMVQIYKLNHSGSASKTYSVRFSLSDFDEIKKLLDLTHADGFALYNGMYPTDDSLNPPGQDYSSRDTVIVVPMKGGKPVPPIDFSVLIDPTTVAPGTAFDHGQLEP
jgi:hypothetical protein